MVASCPWGPPAPHPFHAPPGALAGGANAGRGPPGLPSGVCLADWAKTTSVRHPHASWPDHRVGRGPASEHTDARLDSATPEAAGTHPTPQLPEHQKCHRRMKTRASLRAQQTDVGAPGSPGLSTDIDQNRLGALPGEEGAAETAWKARPASHQPACTPAPLPNLASGDR